MSEWGGGAGNVVRHSRPHFVNLRIFFAVIDIESYKKLGKVDRLSVNRLRSLLFLKSF